MKKQILLAGFLAGASVSSHPMEKGASLQACAYAKFLSSSASLHDTLRSASEVEIDRCLIGFLFMHASHAASLNPDILQEIKKQFNESGRFIAGAPIKVSTFSSLLKHVPWNGAESFSARQASMAESMVAPTAQTAQDITRTYSVLVNHKPIDLEVLSTLSRRFCPEVFTHSVFLNEDNMHLIDAFEELIKREGSLEY